MAHYYDSMCPHCYPDYGCSGELCDKHYPKSYCYKCKEDTIIEIWQNGDGVKTYYCRKCKTRFNVFNEEIQTLR